MEESLGGMVSRLIRGARPGGVNHKRLTKIKGMIESNVFLGPKIRKYIRGISQLADNIECRYLANDGLCLGLKGKGKCDKTTKFVACHGFEAARGNVKENPIELGGQNE